MKEASQEELPATVAETSKQAGDIRSRWSWVEPAVWTERMLAALEKGVKGGVWFSLVDKVYAPRTLAAAWERVQRNRGSGGVDGQTVQQFAPQAPERLEQLSVQLRKGSYQPQPVRRVWIPKPDGRPRPLGIPTLCDRIVQTAVRQVLEPIFEQEFCERSYGFRPGRGAKDALRRVDQLLQAGYRYVLDVDLKSYFDTIPHERLLGLMAQRIADGRMLSLLQAFLKQGVLEGLKEWIPDRGSPQGGPISPLLSNVYLHPLDVAMQAADYEMIRYADDIVVLCRTAQEAEQAWQEINEWTGQAGLELHPEKTRIVDLNLPGGFDFLGYHFEKQGHWPRRSSQRKFKEAIRQRTRRTNGHSLKTVIADLNRISRGWFEYFKHSRRGVFRDLDGWIRMRLRSLLRKRHGLRGRGRGRDHQRWPNAYFAASGFYSMVEAHRLACQSVKDH